VLINRNTPKRDRAGGAVKGPDGGLLDIAIPKVAITKDANYGDDGDSGDPEAEVDLSADRAHAAVSIRISRSRRL
jgi:hypothetical protein